MTDKHHQLLEFDAILAQVAELSKSAEAADLILEQAPMRNEEDVAQLKKHVSAIAALHLHAKNPEPVGALPAIAPLVGKLSLEGVVLEAEEALMIGRFIEEGMRILAWLEGDEHLRRFFAQGAPDCAPLAREIFAVIDREGNLRDIPPIVRIKKAIAGAEAELKTIAASFWEDDATRPMLQSDLPSVRDGRTVVALKANFRGRLRGIVREASASGQTLFIEPEEAVEKNNRIAILKRELAIEIRRALRALSARVAADKDELTRFHRRIVDLETLRARARHSNNTKGVFAAQGAAISLVQARHPLLGARAVPIDVRVKDRVRMTIITGPNTGGKTVALKTVGLFALMNQAGLAIPAAEGSALPIFDNVCADIGDEQSIDNALSTFSAHIKNIAAILSQASERTLVLLDEFGSGTDAAEGAALAMAIADAFIAKKTTLIATTHHSPLKDYAWTHSLAENASMDFDPKAPRPSYKLIMGVPGESRAIDAAEQNGLPPDIIDKARANMDGRAGDVAALIEGLQEKYAACAQEEERLIRQAASLREQTRTNDLWELHLRQKEAEIKSGAVRNLRALLSESRKTLENLVREVKEGELTREKTQNVKTFLNTLAEAVQKESEKAQTEETAPLRAAPPADDAGKNERNQEKNPAPIRPGDAVRAGNDNQRGIVKRAGKKGVWMVEVGSLTLPFDESALRLIAGAQPAPRADIARADLARARPPSPELNLRGLSLSDALRALETHIDGAVIAGLTNFAVIHGKGTGVLSRGVHEYLKTSPVVADYYFSRPELGGFGRTEITLKEG
ncbi:MAG: Smr/MutS family protein [Spirochaetaceae bacterium]|jgi:DNA mismatch repair protein MutS2|nr:Smr/MutS family protein [Spirochaetaceae bacterium]